MLKSCSIAAFFVPMHMNRRYYCPGNRTRSTVVASHTSAFEPWYTHLTGCLESILHGIYLCVSIQTYQPGVNRKPMDTLVTFTTGNRCRKMY